MDDVNRAVGRTDSPSLVFQASQVFMKQKAFIWSPGDKSKSNLQLALIFEGTNVKDFKTEKLLGLAISAPPLLSKEEDDDEVEMKPATTSMAKQPLGVFIICSRKDCLDES